MSVNTNPNNKTAAKAIARISVINPFLKNSGYKRSTKRNKRKVIPKYIIHPNKQQQIHSKMHILAIFFGMFSAKTQANRVFKEQPPRGLMEKKQFRTIHYQANINEVEREKLLWRIVAFPFR